MFRTLLTRFVLPVILGSVVVSFFALPYIDRLLAEWFRSDLELRAQLVMQSIDEPVAELIARKDQTRLRAYLTKITADQRLLAVQVCRPDGTLITQTERMPPSLTCDALPEMGREHQIVQLAQGSVQLADFDSAAKGVPFRVRMVHDLSFVDRRQRSARDFLLTFLGIGAVLLALLVVMAAWWQLRRWVDVLVGDIRGLRFRDDARSPLSSMPVLSQVRRVLREVEASQRLEIDFRENWTPQALQKVVQDYLRAPQVMVVSNREPYIHQFDASHETVVQVPASGMVTALEPVVRACAGTWIAHGSGAADREAVDRNDHVKVPPQAPEYTLRRVWLTPQQEQGYYYGFSNEGLWPLCHLAYVRPAFRDQDWRAYGEVNARFAQVVAQEAVNADPVVLIQDFHLALLPRLIRARVPRATIALFWHIPWPNAETFGVCPWKRELLLHLLDADILGFHTLYHCQNFLATVDRFVECQIDHEQMTVTLRGHVCRVAAYPISIEWPPRWLKQQADVAVARAKVRREFQIGEGVAIGLGVERWDFTKGIVERFHALEALFDQHPKLIGRVTLLQVAAPSRSQLPAYQALQDQTLAEAARINHKFARQDWKPVVLIGEHQDPQRVFELYRAADFCLVNSLHDGMNLVAKEFVAARDDEDGVLILSTFAGASRELIEALLVNPFDVSETAAAIEMALSMQREERRERMRLMRRTVKENNVYRWAGRLLMDLARVRQRQALSAPAGRLNMRRAS
ncbi:MAG: trehalose-6-phosphate synthase [Proteobacteria bacterium]|nr:trehalose-6-phosphate synthase [Pseudomonadota bacterium]